MRRIDPDTADILDVAPFEYTRLAEEMTALPQEFNAPWTEDDIFRTEVSCFTWCRVEEADEQRTIASMLLPVISREMRHAVNTKAVVRESDPALHRGVCGMSPPFYLSPPISIKEGLLMSDFCSSTIFGGFFFCQKCGKDYCLQCERYFSDSMDAIRESPWDLPDAARPRLLRCTLAPPEKGTLGGKPPVLPGGEHQAVEVVPEQQVDRKSSEPNVSTRTNDPPPTTQDDGVPPTNGLPTAELAAQDRPSSDSLPVNSALVNGPHEDSISGEQASDDIVMSESAQTDSALTAAINTQEDTQGTQENTEVQSQPSHDNTIPLSTKSSTTDPIAQVPVLEPRHRPTSYRAAAPIAPAAPPKKNFHVRPDLIPVTRFHAKDLEEHWYKLAAFVLDGTGSLEERMKWFYPAHVEVNNNLSEKVQQYIEKHPTTFPSGPASSLTDEEMSKYYVKTTNPGVEPIVDPSGLGDKSHPFMFVQASELDNTLFDRLWARGEPIVVDKVGEKFKKIWTPDTFIERFGKEDCCTSSVVSSFSGEADKVVVIECETEKVKATSVGSFFESFKDPAQRGSKGVWKLKDWPAAQDFQSAYPDLYNDFCDSLPVPDFTRREGVLNLYAHVRPSYRNNGGELMEVPFWTY